MKKFLGKATLLAIGLLAVNSAWADTTLIAHLSGAQEVPAVTTSGTGLAVFTLSSDGTKLTYDEVVNGVANITAGHIHRGAPGVEGPVIYPLNVNATGPSEFSGSLDFKPQDVPDLLAGNMYTNIHSKANPGGEIRGQIMPVTAGTVFIAHLNGLQEVPNINTVASGLGVFQLQAVTNVLTYDVVAQGLQNTTAGHIHRGAPGVEGPIIYPLSVTPGVFTEAQGTVTINPDDVSDLLSGNLYVNLHTQGNPGGEIRGQLQLPQSDAGPTLYARLTGDQETPPVSSAAVGLAIFHLNSDGTQLDYDVVVEGIADAVGAHLHHGPQGQSGPIIYPIQINTGPVGELMGTINIKPGDVSELLGGDFYINIHTTNNPNGEIRGQITPIRGVGFTSRLTGAEEVPAVTTSATGLAVFTLSLDGRRLTYDVVAQGLNPVSAGELHRGGLGVAGPDVYPLAVSAGQPFGEAMGMIDANPMDVTDPLAGNFYVNLHTVANPNGEIRGQLSPSFLHGDLNANGHIDVGDATVALRIALGLITPSPLQLAIGDVVPIGNPDGKITVGDATAILATAIGRRELIP